MPLTAKGLPVFHREPDKSVFRMPPPEEVMYLQKRVHALEQEEFRYQDLDRECADLHEYSQLLEEELEESKRKVQAQAAQIQRLEEEFVKERQKSLRETDQLRLRLASITEEVAQKDGLMGQMRSAASIVEDGVTEMRQRYDEILKRMADEIVASQTEVQRLSDMRSPLPLRLASGSHAQTQALAGTKNATRTPRRDDGPGVITTRLPAGSVQTCSEWTVKQKSGQHGAQQDADGSESEAESSSEDGLSSSGDEDEDDSSSSSEEDGSDSDEEENEGSSSFRDNAHRDHDGPQRAGKRAATSTVSLSLRGAPGAATASLPVSGLKSKARKLNLKEEQDGSQGAVAGRRRGARVRVRVRVRVQQSLISQQSVRLLLSAVEHGAWFRRPSPLHRAHSLRGG